MLVAVAAVLAVATGCTTTGTGHPTPTTSDSARVSHSPAPNASTGTGDYVPLHLAPGSIVAATAQGAIVELAPDGAVRSELVPREVTGGPPGHVTVAPGGTAVFFDRGRAGCWSEFDYAGGPGAAGEGAWPTPDRDGHRVAAVAGGDSCHPDTLATYQVGGGQAQQWRLDASLASRGLHLSGPLSWSADGARLAVPLAGNRHEVRIVNVGQSTVVTGWAVPPTRPDAQVVAAFFAGTGAGEALLTLELCCGGQPATYRLVRRPLTGASAGPPTGSAEVAEPVDLHVAGAGEVTLTTKTGTILVGTFPALHAIPGKYVAADRGTGH